MATSVDISARKKWVPVMPGIVNAPIPRYDNIDINRTPETSRAPPGAMQGRGFVNARPSSVSDGGYPPSPPIDYNTPSPDYRDASNSPLPRDVIPRVNMAHLIGAHDQVDSAFHQDASISNLENADDVPCRDFFFDSDKVLSLNNKNFTTFLRRKDVALVMFYNDSYPESAEFQRVFSEAASNTKRENHAFAGVDCVANAKLCSANGICKLPVMRLYSRNYCIGEMKTIHSISPEILRQYVEMAPLSDCTRMVKCTRRNR